MRVYAKNTQNYISSLAASITKDPVSMESWRCLHGRLNWVESDEMLNNSIAALMAEYEDDDCDMIICDDRDILIISRILSTAMMMEIGLDFAECLDSGNLAAAPKFCIYDLLKDWKEIRAILLAKINDTELPQPKLSNVTPIFSGGDFSSLQKQRKTRQPMHIMLVEDDSLTRRIFSNLLREEFVIITANDAHEAVPNYLLHAPDIVFLDINLPDMNGFEVLQKIIACDAEAYVVMFSGNNYIDNITNALQNGAAGFVAKPFRQEKIRHYIQNCAIAHNK